jgi:hypothetical protein
MNKRLRTALLKNEFLQAVKMVLVETNMLLILNFHITVCRSGQQCNIHTSKIISENG